MLLTQQNHPDLIKMVQEFKQCLKQKYHSIKIFPVIKNGNNGNLCGTSMEGYPFPAEARPVLIEMCVDNLCTYLFRNNKNVIKEMISEFRDDTDSNGSTVKVVDFTFVI